jgi:AcrR family transcriptional regulator
MTEAMRPVTDHRKGPRRRGHALIQAIYEATIAELTETGYARLTMEGVAARAHTSKASLYRRWPSRADLVLDAIRNTTPELDEPPDTGDLRTDILTVLRSASGRLTGPFGEAVRGLISENLRDPESTEAARARMASARHQTMLTVLERAVKRGEIRPDAISPRVVTVGPSLVAHQFLVHGDPIPDEFIVEIVDEIVLPLLSR